MRIFCSLFIFYKKAMSSLFLFLSISLYYFSLVVFSDYFLFPFLILCILFLDLFLCVVTVMFRQKKVSYIKYGSFSSDYLTSIHVCKFSFIPPPLLMFLLSPVIPFYAVSSFSKCSRYCLLFFWMILLPLTFTLHLSIWYPILNKGCNFVLPNVSHLAHSSVSSCFM